jgi:hypothetical protein
MSDLITITGLWRPSGDKKYIASGKLRPPDGEYRTVADLEKAAKLLVEGQGTVYIFRNVNRKNPRQPEFNLVIAPPSDYQEQPPVDDDVPF